MTLLFWHELIGNRNGINNTILPILLFMMKHDGYNQNLKTLKYLRTAAVKRTINDSELSSKVTESLGLCHTTIHAWLWECTLMHLLNPSPTAQN
jgi:hypothetical protein